MGLLDSIKNINIVRGGSAEMPKVSFAGGEHEVQTGSKGWEQYHNGQGPNGLKAFPDEFTGHKLNMYM